MWIFVFFFVSIKPLEKNPPTQQSWRCEQMPDWPTDERERPTIATLTFVKPKRWTRCCLWKVHKTVHLGCFLTPLTLFSFFSPFSSILVACCFSLYVSLSLNGCRYPSLSSFFSCSSPLSLSILWCICTLARDVDLQDWDRAQYGYFSTDQGSTILNIVTG